nr:MAG TPA: Protein of unknown function (DUF3800) [Caudoviricetes sp.]
MLTQPEEYILFADETNKTPKNPFFCFAGFIIKRCDYENLLLKQINDLKAKYFGKTDIVLHYTDMKNNKGDFGVFKTNSALRNKFWTDLVKIIDCLDITIIGVYYDVNLMKDTFVSGATTNYDIAFRYLLENYMHFLKENNGVGSICVESRTFKENMYLQCNYLDYILNGSIFYNCNDTEKHLASIGFTIKGDNCIGLQIADLIPARLMRIINKQSDNYLLNKTIKSKIYGNGTNKEDVIGIKKII